MILTWAEGGCIAAFSDRTGGVSTGPFSTANVSTAVGDSLAHVIENRRRIVSALGLSGRQVLTVRQCHSSSVVRVSRSMYRDVAGGLGVEADGMVTTDPSVVLMVGVADCAPVVLLGLGDVRAVGILHVGWRGLVDGIIESGVAAMGRLGVTPDSLATVIGPAIGVCCYPVGSAVVRRAAESDSSGLMRSSAGLTSFDLVGASVAVLERLGVERVVRHGSCTAHNPDLFSRRRDGPGGCQAGIAALL